MQYLNFFARYKAAITIGILLGLLTVFVSDHAYLCELWLSLQPRESSLCNIHYNPISLILLPLMAVEAILGLAISFLPVSDTPIATISRTGAPWLQLVTSILIFVALAVFLQYRIRKSSSQKIN